jgi:23S rRNA (uridine2552-2'-O)-methyltransferase
VVELGCWPGGWLQVAAAAVGSSGRVVGVDLTPLEPFAERHVTLLQLDLTAEETAGQVLAALAGQADVLLCDAAPKLTGVRAADRAREQLLLEAVEALVQPLLRPGGDLLIKLLDAPEAVDCARRLAARFERARTLRPAASRKGSRERYLLGRRFAAETGRGADA